jgi:uncharacterized membrane protein YoaK (UPF0700 family)
VITRLPRWVWIGGGVLAFVGGMVNVVGLLGFEHQAVSHLTATTSRLSAAVALRDMSTIWPTLRLTLAFFGGAMLSGWLIRGTALMLGRRYATALLFEAFLLVAAFILLNREDELGMYLCCAACGLQNAMASTYSGAIVRTTHMTGLFTDLGTACGQRLAGTPFDRRRIALYVTLIGGFAAGGFAGALLFGLLGYATLLLPAVITGATALAYHAFERKSRVLA